MSSLTKQPLCCDCRQTTPADHRKRKKLSGKSCDKARDTLVLLSGHGPLELLLGDPQAILCYKCDSALNKSKLEERVTALNANMREKILHL